jgi:hypothetical protein
MKFAIWLFYTEIRLRQGLKWKKLPSHSEQKSHVANFRHGFPRTKKIPGKKTEGAVLEQNTVNKK